MLLPEIWGGLLVGGRSRRMGTAKQNLVRAGSTFAERIVAALTPCTQGVVVLGMGAVPSGLATRTRLADDARASGPLAGLLAALAWRPEVAWLLVGCDQPLISVEAVAWLVAQRSRDHVAVLPRLAGDRVEPLLAIYEPAALPLLLALAASGRHSLQPLAASASVVSPQPPTHLRECWSNVNTPAELRNLDPAGG
jgi:molybdenum cofactor guanylyltransferase